MAEPPAHINGDGVAGCTMHCICGMIVSNSTFPDPGLRQYKNFPVFLANIPATRWAQHILHWQCHGQTGVFLQFHNSYLRHHTPYPHHCTLYPIPIPTPMPLACACNKAPRTYHSVPSQQVPTCDAVLQGTVFRESCRFIALRFLGLPPKKMKNITSTSKTFRGKIKRITSAFVSPPRV